MLWKSEQKTSSCVVLFIHLVKCLLEANVLHHIQLTCSSLGRYKDALSQYNYALTLEPNNDAALQGVKSVAELERKKQQAVIDHDRELAQAALLRHKQQQDVKDQQDGEKNKSEEEKKVDVNNEDEDDMLSDFFDQVEQATVKTTNKSTTSSNDDTAKGNSSSKLKVALSDLGTSKDQIDRLLQSNYEWRNLNPYYVLGISDPRNTDMETVQRRFKALSLLVHPDKCLGDMQQRARDAFEEVNKAMKILLDEDKRNHILGLIDVGKKNARREWEGKVKKEQQVSTYEELEEKSLMKLFAEVEMKRRDVERRKREYEKRERMQEDEILKKQQNEREFDKNWRKTERVEQRVGNWREFHEKKLDTKKAKITKL